MLASTISLASFSSCSMVSSKGDLGRAMRPVRVDSRIPKGAMSLRNESIRDCLAELQGMLALIKYVRKNKRGKKKSDVHLDNAVICADIQHLATKLVG